MSESGEAHEEASFWAVSSYGVRAVGATAKAITDFREAKPGESELEDPTSNPSSRPGTKGSKRPSRPGTSGSAGSNPLQLFGGWARSLANEAESDETSKKQIGLQLHEVPFPWFHPTAISEEVYEDGVHEFLVEVGCVGQIGFVDADFRKEREKLAQHWLNRSTIGRCWILHSNGYFATGNQCTPVSRHARFAPKDRLRIVLDFYKETVFFALDAGVQKEMGSISGVRRPVRFAFQMYYKEDWISVLSHEDKSDSAAPEVKAAAHTRRAERHDSKAQACKDPEEASAWRHKADKDRQLAQALRDGK